MEEINISAEHFKPDKPTPSTNHTGRRSFYFILILFLGLLSVSLMVRLISLGVYCELLSAKNQLSSMTEERNLLSANLSAVNNQLSSMTEERNLLTKELERLQSLFNQSKSCPAGWRRFSCSCYLLSESTGSWDVARKDCRDREADLVVVDRSEEQDFLVKFTHRSTWIGLSDIQEEGKWKWVDGTPLTLAYWATNQPDNGGGDPQIGEEDCAHIRNYENALWNDLSCGNSLPWICEK